MRSATWMVLAVAVLPVTVDSVSAVDVTFPDTALEAEVRGALGISPPTPVTDTDMATLDELSANYKSINNLQGIEYGVNLQSVSLHGSDITDLVPLENLTNLQILYLGRNEITDITPLQNLTGLQKLSLWDNDAGDLTPLQYLTNLSSLNLGYNRRMSDITPLENLTKLEYLQLNTAQISDITPVQNMPHLKTLILNGNDVSDLAAVQNLTDLETLMLYDNQITDASLLAIQGLTKMRHLILSDNGLSDVTPLRNMTDMRELELDNNQISDITSLENMVDAWGLELHNNQISDISVLSGLPNVTRLWLWNNLVTDTTPLQNMKKLRDLRLDDNQIAILNLAGSDLSGLQEFSIAGNPLTGVILADATLSQAGFDALMYDENTYRDGIAELPGVLTLDMSGVDFAGVSDFSKMYAMSDLQELLLSGAMNLGGGQVSAMVGELDSLNLLDVTGLWDTFDPFTQASLNSWGSAPGNTLLVPEPATLSLLTLGGIGVLMRRRRR